MSKKPSFFKRIAGNLRFDDVDDEFEEVDIKQSAPAINYSVKNQERELPVTRDFLGNKPQIMDEEIEEEEVGELPVDVYETPGEIIVQTLIAGVMPEHLSINITRDMLTVSGKREENKIISKDNYHIHELYWGAFTRSIALPAEVEIDGAEAIERHGMLMIKLPKLDKARKTNLKVKSI